MVKNESTTIRTTISVRRDLKRRMDKVKEPVNWSGLASEAFERKLAEIESKKENPIMSDVIERLRTSKRQAESEDYQHGWNLGQEWAEKYASAPELIRLEKWSSEPIYAVDEMCNAFTADELLAFSIHPEDQTRSGAKVFWECAIGPDELSQEKLSLPEFLRGFVEGAIDVWDKVKNQI